MNFTEAVLLSIWATSESVTSVIRLLSLIHIFFPIDYVEGLGAARLADILTVKEQLSKRGELEEVGGPFYITQLSSTNAKVPSYMTPVSYTHLRMHLSLSQMSAKYLARDFWNIIRTKDETERQEIFLWRLYTGN